MSVLTVEEILRCAPVEPAAPAVRPRPAGRGAGRRLRPTGRPVRAVSPPQLRPGARLAGAPAVVPLPRSNWRLTQRGIAVVLVTGAMVVAAALAVVGLTALRVTAETYQPYGPAQVLGSS